MRFNLDGKRIEGLIKINGEIYFIQPAKDGSNFASANEFIVFQSKDRLKNTTFHCPLDVSVSKASKIVESQMPETKFSAFSAKPLFMKTSFVPTAKTRSSAMLADPFSPRRRLEIAVASDLEWYNIEGQGNYTQAVAKIDNQLNLAEAVYEAELGISFTIVSYRIWDSEDPFTTSGDDGDSALAKFTNYFNSNFPYYGCDSTTQTCAESRDMAILFSGYFQDYGVANPGQACYSLAYCIVGRMNPNDVNQQGLIAAHEIAHVLGIGLPNEHQNGSNCTNTIMNSFYGTSSVMTFCQESRDIST